MLWVKRILVLRIENSFFEFSEGNQKQSLKQKNGTEDIQKSGTGLS